MELAERAAVTLLNCNWQQLRARFFFFGREQREISVNIDRETPRVRVGFSYRGTNWISKTKIVLNLKKQQQTMFLRKIDIICQRRTLW